MKLWGVWTAVTARVDLVFEPEFDRFTQNGSPETWFTSVHQMFGCYSERIVPDDGPPIEIRDPLAGLKNTTRAGRCPAYRWPIWRLAGGGTVLAAAAAAGVEWEVDHVHLAALLQQVG